MELNEIKTKLDEKGFVSYIKNDILFAGSQGETDEELGIETMINAFRVTIESAGIKLEYSYGQKSIENFYSSINDLISDVKKTFPLK